MKYFSILLLCFVALSCKKETIEQDPQNVGPQQPSSVSEAYIQEFTDYERKLNIRTKGYGFGGGAASTYVLQSFNFRLTPGQMVNGSYFYGLEMSDNSDNYCNELQTSPWNQVSGYYRYSFADNICYFYSSTTDQNPQVLFDFDVSVGDTVLLDPVRNVQFFVQTVTEQVIQGISFPAIGGKIITLSSPGNSSDEVPYDSGNMCISPFTPNPFWFNESFDNYFMGWSANDFCGNNSSISAWFFDEMSISTKNVVQNNEVYLYDMGGFGPG